MKYNNIYHFIKPKLIHRHSFCFCSTSSEARQFIYQETGIKHSRSVCWTITNIDWAVLEAADSFKQTKSWKISCCKNKSVFPHTWSFYKNIPLVPLLNIIADPFRGGVFYMLIKARLNKHCTYCGCETLKSHHNSLMCDTCPPHRVHGHLFVLLGKWFHVLMLDSRLMLQWMLVWMER